MVALRVLRCEHLARGTASGLILQSGLCILQQLSPANALGQATTSGNAQSGLEGVLAGSGSGEISIPCG